MGRGVCELFGMSSDGASTVNYSLAEFSRHGGLTAGNKDGWGIAYYRDRDARVIKEPAPAATSPWVRLVAAQHLASECVIAHVRLASRGEPRLENTHPFERELAGRRHVFAHNGTLAGIQEHLPLSRRWYRPIGETDSEHAFCVLLERLHDLWWRGEVSVEARMQTIAAFAGDVRALGQANFLYFDGDVLFVHAHKRRYEVDGAHSEPRAPGLHALRVERHQEGECMRVDGLELRSPGRASLLFASVPLSDDEWAPLPEGALLAVKQGEELARISA